ncbi:autoinducer 2 sensor kinase/phosphatase LuxQ [Clostridium chromiireducens]|uniref:Stage 0 sporulation protein A homolog n=2 Tax=Clostridium chromiireducens TaxID=225345 RepID=A0A1V4J104_9CLOT|nr:autoinducer 2 sensor kinase/phosphatase LuxQ [Clostridium chromiireducens]
MNKIKNHENISLYKWIWQSYIRTAFIPLIVVELIFISIYLTSDFLSQKKTIDYFKEQAQNELGQIAKQKTDLINHELSCIENSTSYFTNKLQHALSSSASLSQEDNDSLSYSEDGTYYTKENSKDDNVSIFYSNISSTKEMKLKKDKIAKILTLKNFMIDIKNTQQLSTSIYFNSFDSLNVTYPYTNIISKYGHLADVRSSNFYYGAHNEHNPEKKVKWTNVYHDPSGKGLITSAICPVYNKDFLEGFAGIDVSMDTIKNQILTLDIPWNGYGLLIEKNGTIITLTDNYKNHLDLEELSYNNDNPMSKDNYNLYKSKDLFILRDKINNDLSGFTSFMHKDESMVASWNTISGTNWKLLIIVPEKNIYSDSNKLHNDLNQIGMIIIATLILSYIIFFIILSKKARKMSYTFSNSLLEIKNIIQRIDDGDYISKAPILNIDELTDISVQLLKLGQNLDEANKNLLETQTKLKKKEIDLKCLVNSINDLILEVNSNGYITAFLSKRYQDLYKLYEQGDFSSIYDLLDKKTSKAALEKIQHVIRLNETAYLDINIESNSGLRWFQACISPKLNDSSKVVISARDITDQKKMARSIISAKEEAEKASRAKSEFLSSMSHELRTPLNAILGFSQILQLDPESPLTSSQSQSVDEILKAGKHLLELINEILDLAKIESGKLSISIESVPIKAVMDETLAIIKPFADQHGIDIITYPEANSNEFVSADHTRLKQILINLLSNAIKYNKKHGQVVYYQDCVNDKCRFHVIDTGIGLSSSDLKLIFKPFQRLNKMNNTIEGTGIGLAVAKQLAGLMNGEIHVVSEKNLGSHFWVEFPYVESDFMHNSESGLSIENNNSFSEDKVYKILYVEDNPANLRLVERVLSQICKLKMLSATSGELCMDLAIAHKPDLILLDINLPGIDGYEVFKNLKICNDTSEIPVIAISAHAMPSDIERGMRLGFTDYITKPIDIRNFIDKISNILINIESKN